MSILPIKRQKLTQQIRKKQIESLKRQVRLSFMNQSQSFDQHKFYQLYDQCKTTKFNENCCQIFIEYLYSTKISQFELQKVLEVIHSYLQNFGMMNKINCRKIASIMTKIINLILKQQQKFKVLVKEQKDSFKKQLKNKNQYRIIEYLFQEIIDCMLAGAYSLQIFSVWTQLFFISHKDISQRFFWTFIEVINSNNFNSENSQQINTIIKALTNFTSHQFCQTLNIQIIQASLKILEVIYQEFKLGIQEMKLALKFIKQLLTARQQQISIIRLKRIANTKIISQIILNLSDEDLYIVQKSLQVLNKIFSLTDSQNILEQILIKNNKIMYLLKNLLPVQLKASQKTLLGQMIPENQVMMKFNKKVINNVIIAISNIVATNKKQIEICLQSGMFYALGIMFKNCSIDIKQNISFVFHNLCVLANQEQLQIMTELNLLYFVIELINQKQSYDAVSNGLSIFKHILCLQRFNNGIKGKISHFSITDQIYKLKTQYQCTLNSILFNSNRFQKEAQECLELLDLIESKTQLNC